MLVCWKQYLSVTKIRSPEKESLMLLYWDTDIINPCENLLEYYKNYRKINKISYKKITQKGNESIIQKGVLKFGLYFMRLMYYGAFWIILKLYLILHDKFSKANPERTIKQSLCD